MKGKISKVVPSPSTAMAAVALFVALGGTSYAVVHALPANSVGTPQIRNGAVTTQKIAPNAVTAGKINTAGLVVPNASNATSANHATTADALAPLPSGQSESGTFAGGGGSSTGGYFGFAITFARPLLSQIADQLSASNRIIDTFTHPDPSHCPGAGQASPGYLCLYFHYHNAVGTVYGYDQESPYPTSPVGVGLYALITASGAYVDGVYTVTAP